MRTCDEAMTIDTKELLLILERVWEDYQGDVA
jgi:hypothetical protein